MDFNYDDLIKIIMLINAKSNGWTVLCKNINTFYLIKNKNKNKKFHFSNEMKKLCKNL